MTFLEHLDHIIVFVPSLAEACDDVEARTGVRPAIGGRHPQFGTHNALLSIGTGYIEFMAHDTSLPALPDGVLFGLDELDARRVGTWVLASDDVASASARVAAAGVDLGTASAGHRERPDGEVLRWTLTDPRADRLGRVVPFLIDWGNTPHPSTTAPPVGTLADLMIEHPDPDAVQRALSALDVDLDVTRAAEPALHVKLNTPRGRVALA